MHRLALALTVLLLVASQAAGEEILFRSKDPKGDDRGAGGLVYPSHEVFVPGLFDLLQFTVSSDEQYVYFDFQFAALTNPFRAPEGYFHQRLELYITTGSGLGSDQIQVGRYRLHTIPEAPWDLRLSAVPFGGSRLQIWRGPGSQPETVSSGVTSLALTEDKTIRLQVDRTLLPDPSSAWGYYVLVGAFDGLAEDEWRDMGPGPWQVGGTGVPVFDLLAPRWGPKGQRAQLDQGVLAPVYKGETTLWYWLAGSLATVALGFLLWRWIRGT
ncbi:MAG: hypothetical protein GX199_05135 [Firmicutes bacterium]|nr:hypothetical protein [Bacillota bacterium]